MIIEMRVYTLSFGSAGRYFDLYRSLGQSAQWRILGSPIGYYASEVGDLNQVVHLWRYTSYEERAARRSALWEDGEWLAFVEAITPLIVSQENRFLVDAPLETPEVPA